MSLDDTIKIEALRHALMAAKSSLEDAANALDKRCAYEDGTRVEKAVKRIQKVLKETDQ